jgi:hypothetical protein
MTFEIVRPDDESGEPDAEDEAFRQAQSNLRKAPGDLEVAGTISGSAGSTPASGKRIGSMEAVPPAARGRLHAGGSALGD